MDLDALLTQWFPKSDSVRQKEEDTAEAARAAERPKDVLTYEDEVEQQFAAGTWEEKADPEGKKFWINKTTKALVWNDPTKGNGTASEESELGDPLDTKWRSKYDQNTKRHYYYHKETKAVTWAKPQEYARYEEALKAEEKRIAKLEREEKVRVREENAKQKALEAEQKSRMSLFDKLIGKKPPTKEEAEAKKKQREEDRASAPEGVLRPYKEGRHYVKFAKGDLQHVMRSSSVNTTNSKTSCLTDDNNNPIDVYDGEFTNYKFHGKGTFLHSNGEKYVGEWHKGMQHGKGVKTWPDGASYRGDYVEDFREGQGEFKYADGAVYVGGWRQNKYHGEGHLTYKKDRSDPWPGSYQVILGDDGTQEVSYAVYYKGGFQDGLKHGEGEIVYSDGSRYSGGFAEDRYHGQGDMVYPNGDTYKGEWQEGTPHGHGKERMAELRESYKGEFEQGLRHGSGTVTYKSGWSWTGKFQHGIKTGKGVHTGPDGSKLFGEWWQHALARNTIPDHVAETMLGTYALHEENYGQLFDAQHVRTKEELIKEASRRPSVLAFVKSMNPSRRMSVARREGKMDAASDAASASVREEAKRSWFTRNKG